MLGHYLRRIAHGMRTYLPQIIVALLTVIIIPWTLPPAALAILRPYAFFILIGALALWGLPKWQSSNVKDRLTLENAARQTLAQIIGGAVLIAGLFFTWENLKITQETATQSQETATRNLEIAQEGQVTERFTRAIDQLGAVNEGKKQLEIRLGGIYALARIAKDSKDDHWPIMEVLTAYVRANAPRQELKTPQDVKTFHAKRPAAKPEADIQAVLTVLGRRTRRSSEEADQRLNLARTDLRRADLRGAHLERAILEGAHLQDAILDGAHLKGADFTDAGMAGASVVGADLRGAGKTLTADQLSDVKRLPNADSAPLLLDQQLREEIRQQYPDRKDLWEKRQD